MPITRARAIALLNKGEMRLYDDSRINAARALGAADLARRIDRARKARDRARDLLRRQTLASRQQTGSKRGVSGRANQRSKDKAALLADILKRFEARLKAVEAAGAESGKGGRPRKATKNAGKKAAEKAAGQTAGKMVARTSRGAAGKPAKRPAGRAAAGAAEQGRQRTGGRRGAITSGQALENTRALLETRREQAREPRVWPSQTDHAGQVPGAGFQSAAAAHRAEELHAGQSRVPAIQGSIGTRGRINQGKRDHRGQDGEG